MNSALKTLPPHLRRLHLQEEAALRKEGAWGSWKVKNFPAGSAGRDWAAEFTVSHVNEVFSVLDRRVQTSWGEVRHLAVASISGIRPTWHEMQRIKDEIAGSYSTAIEVHPPHDRVVDEADMFHIWVLPSNLPFGIHRKDVADAAGAV